MKYKLIILIISILFSEVIKAQKIITIDELIDMAVKNNNLLKTYELEKKKAYFLSKTAFDVDKTGIGYEYDPTNAFDITGVVYKNLKISQDLDFPSVYFSRKKMLEAENDMVNADYELELMRLKKNIYLIYETLSILEAKKENYILLDSLYSRFREEAERKYSLGESNLLDKLLAQSQCKKIHLQLVEIEKMFQQNLIELRNLVQTPFKKGFLKFQKPQRLELKMKDIGLNPLFVKHKAKIKQSEYAYKTEKRMLLPGLSFEYTYGNTWRLTPDSYSAYVVGINIPLFFGPQKNKLKAAKITQEQTALEVKNTEISLSSKRDKLLMEFIVNQKYLDYYESEGQLLSKQLSSTAEKSYKAGEINFFQYIQTMQHAIDIENEYLDQLESYNKIVLELNYLILD